jgi:TRAP-type mannitol/chloroaromatic compound transport system permease large subunit
MFQSVQFAFRRLPGSLAVTTLAICTFWGIASGLVGAVVVLMGVIAMRPMLNAGYDTRLAAGVITAGGTLGILIPPSVMIIVYAAVAGQSVVKLYAAAIFPGFFLAFLYMVYVIGWAVLDPKVAPKLPMDQMRAPISPWVDHISKSYSRFMLPALIVAVVRPAKAMQQGLTGINISWLSLVHALVRALAPLFIVLACLGASWWYVVIHSQAVDEAYLTAPQAQAGAASAVETVQATATPSSAEADEPLQAMGEESTLTVSESPQADEPLQEMGVGEAVNVPKAEPVPEGFYVGFLVACLVSIGLLAWYYWGFDAEQYEILSMLITSVMPLGILTFVVLGVILFGITTATESAAVGAAGAFLMAWSAGTLNFARIKEAVFLTAKTTSMVCWLFVGSALFSAVFAILGGQRVVEEWVMSLNLSPIQFLLLSQAIIFILGWPLEWTEIIVIFVPIFLPLLQHFQVDPLLWGVLVFVNLQAAFLSPPVAMSAFYLKGVSPPHVTINQIFAGMMPYMLIVIVCMVIMYIWPQLTLWLPNYLYGR